MMSELKMVTPLLDHMAVEKELSGHNGRTCYTLRNTTGERFILKRISVPASDSQVRALILSGAYPDEAAVHAYYGRVAADIRTELEAGKKLAASGCFAGAVAYQIEPKETGVGYDIYILYPLYIPLNDFYERNAMTNLRAVNLGIDICDAISACREAGYLFGNIKPENIYFMTTGKFLLGDLGLVSLQELKYSCLPEEYIGAYSAPELADISTSPNTTIDLYALGMVLYRIYNGNHGPFEDENTGEAMADKLRTTGKPLPTPIYADYELAGIILKACAFKQSDRYQTPEELKQALVLYMQRNEVSDTLIVPPIVAEVAPITEDAAEEVEEEEAPIRMTDAEKLDEDFRRSFAPDLSGAGTEADIDPTIVVAPVPGAQKKEAKPAAQEPAKKAETPPVKETPSSAEEAKPAAEEPKPEPAPKEAIPFEEAAEAPAKTGKPSASRSAPQKSAASPRTYAAPEDDPDQMDLDELLASINRCVGEVPAPIPAEETEYPMTLHIEESPTRTHDYVDPAVAPEEEPEEAPPKRGKAVKISIILVLLLAIGAVAYYLLTWYFVDVTKLNLLSCTTEQIVVELESEDSIDRFSLLCTDNYGTAYPCTANGNLFTFTGLRENTTYTVTVSAASHHKLTSASTYALTLTTPESTEITSFTAARGDADGEVLLSFTQEGPAPTHWRLSYNDGSGKSETFDFEGNSYLVTGLQQYKRYTFTLENTESVYLSGQTTVEYELLPIVEVKNLNVSEISGNTVTVVWESGKNRPDEWTLTCEAQGLETITATTSETSHIFTLPDLARDYTISVSAGGMDTPESLLLPATPIIIESIEAQPNEDGTVTVTWETPVGAPEGGWYISYNTVGSYHSDYMYSAESGAVSGNSVVLSGLIPNAEYEVSLALTASDVSQPVFGMTKTTFRTAEAGAFDEFGVSPTPPLSAASGYISLWLLPEKENWSFNDLRNHKTAFSAEEKIAVCIEINAVNASTDDVSLLYVLRDGEGRVVNDVSKTLPWNDIWYSRRHAGEIPLPAKSGEASDAGSYTLEIYVNGKLLASTGFTIA